MYACCAKLLPSCLILCNPMDCSLPGSSIPGILQARTVEWVAISFPNAWKWKVKVRSLSHVWLLVTSWTAAYQAPPSMGFSRQEYWSGVPVSHWGSSKLPYDPEIPWLGIYPEKTTIQRDLCTPMPTAALLTTARTWKESRCSSTGEWKKKLWCIYTMEYYSAIKRKALIQL